jgi:hypothetical protein
MKSENATKETGATSTTAAAENKKYTPTPEQIAEWKAKYGDIFAYETEDGEYACYLKRPSRQVVEQSMMKGQGSGFKIADVILDNCWLGGNPELRSVDKYFTGLQNQIGGIIEVATGELKKL